MSKEQWPIVRVPKVWVDQIRSFMRDYPELNELIEGEESTDSNIADAIVEAMDEFNSITPNGDPLDINPDRLYSINRNVRRMIFKLAVAILLESVSLYMQRNEITTPSGNIQENLNEKWRSYDSTIKRLKYGDTGIEGVIPIIKKYKVAISCGYSESSIHSEMYYPYMGRFSSISVLY